VTYGTKFASKEIRGRKIDLYVSSGGKFNADWDDETIECPTVGALLEKLSKITKVNLGIKFCRWDDGVLKHGVITGLHGANGNILVRLEGEKGSQQEYTYTNDNGKYLKLTKEQEAEYTGLQKALEAAQTAVEEFDAAHSFNASKVIKEALVKVEGAGVQK
jgi:hypothetical protein